MASSLEIAMKLTAQTEGVEKGMRSAQKTVKKQLGEIQDEEKKNAGRLDRIKKDLADKEEKYIKEVTAENLKQMRMELRGVEKNSKKEFEVKQKFLKKFEKLHKNTIKRQQARDKSSVASLGKGDKAGSGAGAPGIGGLMDGMKGLPPQAMAVTAALGTAAAGFKMLTDKASEMQSAMAGVRSVLGNVSSHDLKMIQAGFQATATVTGKAATEIAAAAEQAIGSGRATADSVNQYMSQVSQFAQQTGQDVSAAESQVGEIILGFGKNVEDTGAILDQLASINLNGSIPSMSQLGDVMAKGAVSVKSLGLDMEDLGAIITSTTSQGFQLSQVSRFLDTMSESLQDSTKMAKVMEIGTVEGFDAINGKVTDSTKFFGSLSSIYADNKTALLDIFPGPAFVKGFDTLFDTTGKGFAEMRSLAEGAGGAFQGMYDSIEDTQRVQQERLSQGWNNLLTNIGQQTIGGTTEVTRGFADMVGSIAEFFEPTEVKISKALDKANEFNQSANILQNILDNPATSTATQLKLISDQVEGLGPEAAIVKEEMQAVLDNQSISTEEKLKQLNVLMRDAIALQTQAAEQNAAAAWSESAGQFNDTLRQNVDFVDVLSDKLQAAAESAAVGWGVAGPVGLAFGSLFGMITGGGETLKDTFEAVSSEFLPQAQQRVDDLREALDNENLSQIDRVQIYEELGTAQVALQELQKQSAGFQDSINQQAKLSVDYLTQMNDGMVGNVDSAEAYQIALAKAPEELKDSALFQEQLRKSVDETLKAEGATEKEREKNLAVQQEQLDAEVEKSLTKKEYIKYLEDQLSKEGQTNQLINEQRQTKLDQLQAEQAIVDTNVEQLKTQGAINFAAAATTDEKKAALDTARQQLQAELELAQAALETAKAQGSGADELKKAEDNIKNIESALSNIDKQSESFAQNMSVDLKGLKDQITKVQKPTGVQQQINVGFAEQEQLRKFANEVQKSMDEYNRAIEQATQEYETAQKKLQQQYDNEASQKRIEAYNDIRAMRKLRDDRRKAESELRKNISEMARDLRDSLGDFESSQIESVLSNLENMLTPLERLTLGFSELAESQEEEIEKLGNQINEKNRLLSDIKDSESGLNEALRNLKNEFNQATGEYTRAQATLRFAQQGIPMTVTPEQVGPRMAATPGGETVGSLTTQKESLSLLNQSIDASVEKLNSEKEALQAQLDYNIAANAAAAAEKNVVAINERTVAINDLLDQKKSNLLAINQRSLAIEVLQSRQDQLNIELERQRQDNIDEANAANLRNRQQYESEVQNAQNAAAESLNKQTTLEEELRTKEEKIYDVMLNRRQTQQEINELEKARSELGASQDIMDARQVQRMVEFYDQQDKVLEIQEELAKEIDPVRIKQLERELEIEQSIYDKLLDYHGTTRETIKDSALRLANSISDVGLRERAVVAAQRLAENTEKISDGYSQLTQLSRQFGESSSKIEEIQSQIGADTDKNKGLYEDINVEYEKQAQILNRIIAMKKEELALSDDNTDRQKEVIEDLAEYEGKLQELRQSQSEVADQSISDPIEEASEEVDPLQDALQGLQKALESLQDIDFGDGLQNALSSVKEIQDLLKDGLKPEEMGQAFAAMANMAAGVVEVVASIPGAVDKISDAFSEFGAGGAVVEVSKLVQQVGSALLGSGVPPLQIAGAVLLAVGLIGEAIGEIVKAVIGREKTAMEVAEERAATEARITAEYQSQMDALDTLGKLGDKSLTSAKERLANEIKIHDQLVQQSAERQAISEMEKEGLVESRAETEARVAANEELIVQAENLLSGSKKQRTEFLRSQGVEVTTFTNRKKAIKSFVEGLNTQNAQYSTTLGMLGEEVKYRESTLGLLRKANGEHVNSLDLLKQLSLRQNSSVVAYKTEKEILQSLKKTMIDMLDLEGISIPLDLDNNSVVNLLTMKSDMFDDFDEETKSAIGDYLAGLQSIGDDVLADQERLIELRRDAQEISEDQAKEQLLDLYNAEIDRLISINATEEEILELKIKILDAEKSLNDELDEEGDKQSKLADLVRQRQDALKDVRDGTKGGDMLEINRRIKSELESQGLSEEEINKFMSTLPKRESGGPVTEGLAMMHGSKSKPEYVMKSDAVQKYGIGLMDRINNMSLPTMDSDALRHLTGVAMQNNSNQNINITVHVDNDFTGVDQNTAQQISAITERSVINAINKGIQSRDINLTLGGRV